ncbi:hypothetical protein ABLN79_15675, partial [Mycobacterium tuberculosis]
MGQVCGVTWERIRQIES